MKGCFMNKDNILKILKSHLPFIRTRFYVKDIGIFGSFVRKEEHETSDIDILVDIEDGHHDLFNYLRLRYYLEELFDTKVDLVIKESVKSKIRERIFREVVYA